MDEGARGARTANDLILGESPRWHDDRLWFSDWGTQEVLAVDLEGTREVIVRVPSFPFCIDWLPGGRLLIVSSSDRRLLRMEPDGSLATHADLPRLSDLPWNEIVVDGRGNTYLNNIGFDMMASQQAGPGIVALVTPDGSTRQVADGVLFPNGMVVTPDNSTLILAESYGQRLTAFDIEADGGLSNRRMWADLDDGAPDGICLDAEGAVWFGDVPNKRCVRVREGGEVLQTIELDRGCFACMLGGPDGRTLFMMAADWRGPAAVAEQHERARCSPSTRLHRARVGPNRLSPRPEPHEVRELDRRVAAGGLRDRQARPRLGNMPVPTT